MLVFKDFLTPCKYYMRYTLKFALAILYTFWFVPISYAQAVTLPNVVEGELYTESSHPELYCLAKNIYFEAKSEPIAGQYACLLYTSPSPRDQRGSRMPSSA